MRECILESYTTKHSVYRGDSYMRAVLLFKIVILGLFTYKKQVVYDVTMFDNFKQHTDYWDSLIKNNSIVPFRIIKSRNIFG